MRLKCRAAAMLVVAICALGAAACGSSGSGSGSGSGGSGGAASNKRPVRFEVMSIQMPGDTLLPDLAAGANAAAKQINAKGGFGGRKVVIGTCNTMSNPSASTNCAHKTLGQHPVAEFGCETTWSISGLPVYAAAKIPSFNCADTTGDFTNPWNFGVVASAVGDEMGLSAWLCARSAIKNIVPMFPDLPAFRSVETQARSILQHCGKRVVSPVYYPLSAVDMSPYTTRVVQSKPDFVLMLSLSGAQVVNIFKALKQAGLPASKVGVPDTSVSYPQDLKPAGAAMEGVYAANQFASWGDKQDPDVAAYLKAMKGTGVDPTNASVEWGYAVVQLFYEAAKQVGFDKFDSATLTHFMRTANGVHMPLSATIVNPGPAHFPQQKVRVVQITQWKNGKMSVVPTGPKKDGWVNAY